MEVLGLVLVSVMLAVIIGAVLGFMAFLQVRELRDELTRLRQSINAERGASAGAGQAASAGLKPQASPDQPRTHSVTPASTSPSSPADAQIEVAKDKLPEDFELELDLENDAAKTKPSAVTSRGELRREPVQGPDFWDRLQQQWMVWLGGLCVGLSGIFLAKYSIEQGLLGPTARIAGGILTGLALHVGALWLRAKQGAHPSFAALAGGGSITLFAALLASLHLYHMFSPITVFVFLAAVAIGTLYMALLHGPVLAAIGMLGAYSVPLLVSTGSGNVLMAMLYALIISCSVLWLLRMVYRPWLWWGCLGGGLVWWALSFSSGDTELWRTIYLAVLAYISFAIAPGNFTLAAKPLNHQPHWPLSKVISEKDGAPFWLTMALIWSAYFVTLLVSGWFHGWYSWLLLPALTLWLAGFQPKYSVFGWGGLLFTLGALLLHQLDDRAGQWLFEPIENSLLPEFFTFLVILGALYLLFSLRNLQRHAPAWWASLAAMLPVLLLLTAYLLGDAFVSVWQWAMVAFVFAAMALWLAFIAQNRSWPRSLSIWLLLAGHFAYALIAAWLLENATLTLAIASQLVSLAWVMRRFNAPELGWLFKGVALVVVVRLTLNPWLASYTQEGHWTLWTYGGATAMCFIAGRWLAAMPQLSRWAEAAALHLFVLTVWSEARYWLHEGQVYSSSFTAVEATLNLSLFAALGLVYHWKAQISERVATWYAAYSKILLAGAALNYGCLVIAFFASNPWLWQSVGEQAIFNLVLCAFGLPIGWFIAIRRFHGVELGRWMPLAAAAAALLFVTIEIRHLWQASIALTGTTSDGELYTYSIVWLGCAVVALLGGSWRWGQQCYRAGMGLLAVVIVKIFLIDMADLEGLWRVASFMGLGLALLGVAFLHQKIQRHADSAGSFKAAPSTD